VWWADLPTPAGRRPVLLLSRDEAYEVRALVTAAPVTTRVRNTPVEVRLSPADGIPRESVVNLDTLTTVPKSVLKERLATLSESRMREVNRALAFALGLEL
jgi:mRNA interferase MazF